MKRTVVMMLMLVVMVMVASAQVITYIEPDAIYLSNGTKVYTSTLPPAHFRLHATIEQCIAETQYNEYQKEARKYQLTPGAAYGGYNLGVGMYGVGMYGLGTTGSTFSIGNGHWSVGTSSTNYGGYKTKTTGIKIGSFHIGTSSAKYVNPYNTRSDSSASYQIQKKADAKKAAQRYSQTRTTGVTNNSQTSTTQKATTTAKDTTRRMWMY